jgi:hypothetical protein
MFRYPNDVRSPAIWIAVISLAAENSRLLLPDREDDFQSFTAIAHHPPTRGSKYFSPKGVYRLSLYYIERWRIGLGI